MARHAAGQKYSEIAIYGVMMKRCIRDRNHLLAAASLTMHACMHASGV